MVGFKGGKIPVHCDDITWCAESGCPVRECIRNTVNMKDRTGLHSYAMFRETDECPIYYMEHRMDQEDEQ